MSTANVNALFGGAADDGILSPGALQALTVNDLGAMIQAGLGIDPDSFTGTGEAFVTTMMPDDSGSIRFAGNSDAVRQGHNLVLDALGDSKQAGSIIVSTRYLNGHVLFDYRPLATAIRLDTQNYNPGLGTPLYDQSLVLLGGVIAKIKEFSDSGVTCRTGTLIISDGADEHSSKPRGGRGTTAQDVALVVRDLLAMETNIVAAMGIADGHTDFRRVFGEMGIPDQWILTPGDTPSEIRKAFGAFSKSMVRASQNAGSFSKQAVGGFGA